MNLKTWLIYKNIQENFPKRHVSKRREQKTLSNPVRRQEGQGPGISIRGSHTWPVPSQQQDKGLANSLNAQTGKREGVFTMDFHTKATAFLAAVQQNLTYLSNSSVQGRAGHVRKS